MQNASQKDDYGRKETLHKRPDKSDYRMKASCRVGLNSFVVADEKEKETTATPTNETQISGYVSCHLKSATNESDVLPAFTVSTKGTKSC